MISGFNVSLDADLVPHAQPVLPQWRSTTSGKSRLHIIHCDHRLEAAQPPLSGSGPAAGHVGMTDGQDK